MAQKKISKKKLVKLIYENFFEENKGYKEINLSDLNFSKYDAAINLGNLKAKIISNHRQEAEIIINAEQKAKINIYNNNQKSEMDIENNNQKVNRAIKNQKQEAEIIANNNQKSKNSILNNDQRSEEIFNNDQRAKKQIQNSFQEAGEYITNVEQISLVIGNEHQELKTPLFILKEMPYSEYLKTDHWKNARKEARKRAGNKCQLCANKEDLHVHHNNYNNRGEEKETDLVVLCATCHSKFHQK